MDVSSIISSVASTYTVTRRAAASYSNGRAVAPSPSTFTIRAVVLEMSGRDLQRLPEGLRAEGLKSIWTTTELKTQGGGFEPDTLVIKGDTYQVERVFDWSDLANCWHIIVAKVGR
jgi:hypothetical protein